MTCMSSYANLMVTGSDSGQKKNKKRPAVAGPPILSIKLIDSARLGFA